jgi:sulfur carrier protein ThiS
LGEFLDIWKGLDVNDKTVQATVNGNPVSDFRDIILNDGDSIRLNIS